VTLGDASGRSVVVTLWNDNANSPLLAGCEGQALQITSVRVGDYNGCSASSGMRSVLTLNPDTKGARGGGRRGGGGTRGLQQTWSRACGGAGLTCDVFDAPARPPRTRPRSRTPEGRALREWQASEGASASFAPLGSAPAGQGEGGRRGGKLNFLSDIVVGWGVGSGVGVGWGGGGA
jgi:hypothetical protein